MQLQVNPAEDPILKNVNPEILSQAIAAQCKKDEHEFELKKLDRTGDWHSKIYATVVIGAVLFLVFSLCWLFLYFDKAQYAEKIITLVIGLSGGLAGGFGLGRLTGARKESNGK